MLTSRHPKTPNPNPRFGPTLQQNSYPQPHLVFPADKQTADKQTPRFRGRRPGQLVGLGKCCLLLRCPQVPHASSVSPCSAAAAAACFLIIPAFHPSPPRGSVSPPETEPTPTQATQNQLKPAGNRTNSSNSEPTQATQNRTSNSEPEPAGNRTNNPPETEPEPPPDPEPPETASHWTSTTQNLPDRPAGNRKQKTSEPPRQTRRDLRTSQTDPPGTGNRRPPRQNAGNRDPRQNLRPETQTDLKPETQTETATDRA